MICKSTHNVAARLKDTGDAKPRRIGRKGPGAHRRACGRALLAALLLIGAFIPGGARADIPERSYAESAPHPVHDQAAETGEKASEEQAKADSEPAASPQLLKYLEDQKCADVSGTASLLLEGIRIAQNAGYSTPDPLLLACLAKPESRFNEGAIGRAGERGLLQVHPCHKRSMARMGLDFMSGPDRIAFACVLWNAQGLRPWSTRRAAQRDYNAWSDG